jgi:uncharacterized membrane protein
LDFGGNRHSVPDKILVDRTSSRSEEPSAMDVLKRRYASGEISKEEYEEKKKELIS